MTVTKNIVNNGFRAVFLIVATYSGDSRPRYVVILTFERKLIKSRVYDGLKMVNFYLPQNRPEK